MHFHRLLKLTSLFLTFPNNFIDLLQDDGHPIKCRQQVYCCWFAREFSWTWFSLKWKLLNRLKGQLIHLHQLSVFKQLKIVFAKVITNLFNKEQFSSHNLNQKFGLNHKADMAATENPSYVTLIEL